MALAQQPEIEEKTTYYKINLDQIYRESTESENDWIDKDRQGIKAPLNESKKFGKIGKVDPMSYVQ